MRIVALSALALFLCTPALPQDSEEEVKKKIFDKVDKILDESEDRLLDSIRKTIREGFKQGDTPGKTEPAGDLASALDLITAERLKKHLMHIADDDFGGRNAGFPENDKVSEYIANVFKEAGLKPVGDKDEDGNPTYFQEFSFRSFYTGGKKLTTRNVLGLIEGTDPVLKKEIVVVGGHHDHVGKDGQGRHLGRIGGARGGDKIWNGADDNGSGSTSVMGLAQAFGEGKIRCKRSILFMTFSAEEAGLYGSKHYANNPIKPIGDHVFMLNLDMVGRNPDKAVEIKGTGSDKAGIVTPIVKASVKETGLKADIQTSATIVGGDSDHTSFKNKKVPFIFFFTGFHPDYHKVSDHPDKIAYKNMAKIGKTAMRILVSVANSEKRPSFTGGGSSRDIPEYTPRPRRRLGVTVGDLTEDDYADLKLEEEEGASLVETVRSGSVADDGGLQEGDFIVSMGGKPFPREGALDALRKRIADAKAGKDVEVVVVRDGKRKKLSIHWEK